MYNLFLDDVRSPGNCINYVHCMGIRPDTYVKYEWMIVRNYKEFVNTILGLGLPERISFDHDLADIHYDPRTGKESFAYQEETGYDCAKFLVDFCIDKNLPLPEYFVHSMNPVGRENIQMLLDNYKRNGK